MIQTDELNKVRYLHSRAEESLEAGEAEHAIATALLALLRLKLAEYPREEA